MVTYVIKISIYVYGTRKNDFYNDMEVIIGKINTSDYKEHNIYNITCLLYTSRCV